VLLLFFAGWLFNAFYAPSKYPQRSIAWLRVVFRYIEEQFGNLQFA